MIVKIQLSLLPPDSTEVLIHNQDRSFQMRGDGDTNLIELMNGRKKVFFHAELSGEGTLKLGDEAKWQRW